MANRNQLLVPGVEQALDQFKYEIAQEFGVTLGSDTVARSNGSVGGEMTKDSYSRRNLKWAIQLNKDMVKYAGSILAFFYCSYVGSSRFSRYEGGVFSPFCLTSFLLRSTYGRF